MIQQSSQSRNIISEPFFGSTDFQTSRFIGEYKNSPNLIQEAYSGQFHSFHIQENDLIRISTNSKQRFFYLACLSPHNQSGLKYLTLDKVKKISLEQSHYYLKNLEDKLNARNLKLSDLQFIKIDLLEQENENDFSVIFKSKAILSLFLVFPIEETTSYINGTSIQQFEIEIKRHNHNLPPIPEYIGILKDEFIVDRATARAYQVKKGEYIQIIDFEGQQCSDFMAMNAHALDQGKERFIDSTVTRTLVRGAYPIPGLFSKFFDQDMQPLIEIVQDTVGRHDTFGLACTAKGYEERGFPGHVNCSDNISHAYKPYGIEQKKAWPAINFFYNTWILQSDNQIQSDICWSQAGDYVLMKALTDLICVSTSCPDDIDPINGWNPTDVLVRIYTDLSRPKQSIGFRPNTTSNFIMSKESPFYPRLNQLTNQFNHHQTYSTVSYFDATGTIEEYWNCKNNVSIQDMSNLRVYDVYGEDAEQFLDLMLTKNVRKLSNHKSFYALLCNEFGSVIDDGTLFKLNDNLFRWCSSSDESAYYLKKIAQELKLNVWIRDMSEELCNLAIQGPKSYSLLNDILFVQPTQTPLQNLNWFASLVGRLYNNVGIPFFLSRTGFTGELGYEIFCAKKDALQVWDALIQAGEKYNLTPMGGNALDMLRIEAGLMAKGAEFGNQILPHEAGLQFAVDLKKETFIGKEAIEQQSQNQRQNLVGLILEGNETPVHQDLVYLDRKPVGMITSATKSPQLKKTIAFARVETSLCQEGTKLTIGKLDGKQKQLKCKTTSIPFIDPKRLKPRTSVKSFS